MNRNVPYTAIKTESSSPSSGLNPYSGIFDTNEVVQLLKRTMFGCKPEQVDLCKTMGLNQSILSLLDPSQSLPLPPVKEYLTPANVNANDANIQAGDTWVFDYNTDPGINVLRRNSFKKWWVGVLVNQDFSIREKMTMFWHNHFVTETSVVSNAQIIYNHHALLRSMALGNYKELVKAVSVDPAMLIYLNGNQNTVNRPNENYARELQELFCCGKGPQSRYTEDDVKAMARVLTGWQIDAATGKVFFDEKKHDTDDKIFSGFYHNHVVKGQSGALAGANELNDLVEMLFSVDEVSLYFCRCLYRWFIYYDIDDQVEANVIVPLAEIFRSNHFEIKPVLQSLLQSEHFFDSMNKGCQIKSPVDYVIGICREFDLTFQPASDFITNYGHWAYLLSWLVSMQQNIGDPPDVSGWKAYYQAPQYYELWISSDTLPKRKNFSDNILMSGYTVNRKKIIVDPIAFSKKFSNPGNPDQLIEDAAAQLFRFSLLKSTRDKIKKDILLGGQNTDYYWTDVWNYTLNNPNDEASLQIVKNKLSNLYKFLLNLPEYQLI